MPTYYFYAGDAQRFCHYIRTATPFTPDLLTWAVASLYLDLSEDQLRGEGLCVTPPLSEVAAKYEVRIRRAFDPENCAKPSPLALLSVPSTPVQSIPSTPASSSAPGTPYATPPRSKREPTGACRASSASTDVTPSAESARVRQATAEMVVGTSEPVDQARKDRQRFQALLRMACLIRDQCCVVTGNPIPSEVDAAHVLSPAYAREWLSERPDLLDLTPTVSIRSGEVLSRPGYDVRNAIILGCSLHGSFDQFEWAITKINGNLRTFLFRKNVCPAVGIRLPASLPSPYEDYLVSQFPTDEVFQEHFRQAVLKNVKAAGHKDEPGTPDDGSKFAAGVDDAFAFDVVATSLDSGKVANMLHGPLQDDVVGNSLFV